jgi:hypothetical protein
VTAVTDFRAQMQIGSLASLLAVDASELAGLERLGADYVHDLRLAVSAHLFDDQATLFQRVSRLAPLVPNAVVAKIVPKMVPPLVAGRAAGALGVDHPSRIEDLLGRLPAEYLASCAGFLDPRAIAEIAPKVTGEMLIPAARVLIANRDYATAAEFVEFATDELVRDLIDAIDDDYGLVMTGALVYSDRALDLVIRALPATRYQSLFQGALVDEEAALSAVSVLSRLSPDLRLTMIEVVAPTLDQFSEAIVRDLITHTDADPSLVSVAEEILAIALEVRGAV